jgi:hypothetical protein
MPTPAAVATWAAVHLNLGCALLELMDDMGLLANVPAMGAQ